MKLEEAFKIINNEFYDDFILENWEDGELLKNYTVIKKSGLGSVPESFGNNGTYRDTWVVSYNNVYYPAKIVKNSINDKIKVRIYKKDGTKDKNEAFKKCLDYHREIKC
jgi:hypothetical protein